MRVPTSIFLKKSMQISLNKKYRYAYLTYTSTFICSGAPLAPPL